MSRIDKFPGNVATGQVTAPATAGGILIKDVNNNRRSITIINHGTTAVYVGPLGVTALTGAFLVGIAGACLPPIMSTAALYAITGGGTQTISFIEEYD